MSFSAYICVHTRADRDRQKEIDKQVSLSKLAIIGRQVYSEAQTRAVIYAPPFCRLDLAKSMGGLIIE